MKRKHLVDDREKAEALGAECAKCPLNGVSARVFAEGHERAKVAIIGEGPGKHECEHGRPFIGQSGIELESWLAKLNVSRTDVLITNATLCMPPGGDLKVFETRKKKDIEAAGNEFRSSVDCCRLRLFTELRIRKCSCGGYEAGPEWLRCKCARPGFTTRGSPPPAVLIPTGNYAMKALLGFEGITNWRGSIIDVDRWRMTGSVFGEVKPMTSEQFLKAVRR